MGKSFFYTLLLAGMFFGSCGFDGETVTGNGNHKSEIRHPGSASKIVLVGDINVFVDKGAPSVKVEGDENILQYIETRINNGWLEIKTRDHINIHSSTPTKVYVSSPELSDLRVTGSGNLTLDEKFSAGNKMSFSVTGSGNINAEINAPEVEARITGSGNLYLKGEARNVDIEVTGSGNYNSPDLKAEDANVKIMGSGDVTTFADANLKVSIAGSGDVKYKGNASVNQKIAGSGSVKKI